MAELFSVSGPLARRTTSAFPLSIGTSLAFESVFEGYKPPYDPARIVPNHIKIGDYTHCFINLGTLVRNIVGAIKKDEFQGVTVEELYDVLCMEIGIIQSLFENDGQGVCQPFFYFCSYNRQYTHQNHDAIKLREDKTDAQRLMTSRLMAVMREFFKQNQGPEYQKLDDKLPVISRCKALVLTHAPFDLLSYRQFQKLDLLESHTGKLKPRSLWYTKYYKIPNEHLNTLPFLRKLLLIFGDHFMFHPLDMRFRKMILDISRQCQWTPLTTEEKVLLDLSIHIKEPYLVMMINKL